MTAKKETELQSFMDNINKKRQVKRPQDCF